MDKSVSFTFHFSLFITEEYDVEKVSKTLKMEPSQKWVKNDLIRGSLFRKESCWKKSSKEIFSFTFSEPFLGFLQEFEGAIPSIQQLIKEDGLICKVDAVVSIYEGDTMPGIDIDETIIATLSSIKCRIDFDIYDYREGIAKG